MMSFECSDDRCHQCKGCECTCHDFKLTKEEARAIVTELGKTFIDRDNPLCNEVLGKLMRFVNES